jgi:predicted phage-related endonuclease
MAINTKIADRRYFIGGSDARIIMGVDEAALTRLWHEKRGEVEPEDLSGNLVVQLGLATEDLNRRWYQAQHPPPSAALDGSDARWPCGGQ